MSAYKTGKGRGTKTVEARQFLHTRDEALAYWAGGVLHAERNGDNVIRIHRAEEKDTLYVTRYDWIVKYPDGEVVVESPEDFRDNYRPVKDSTTEEKGDVK